MFGQLNLNGISIVRNFAVAEAFFNHTKPLRGKGMMAHERPLHDKRGGAYKKFRIAKQHLFGRDAYDLVLYQTPVIRFYRPNPDGTYHVSIRGYNSSTTDAFLSYHGWSRRWLLTDTGQEVLVPYGAPISDAHVGAFLTFTHDNRLITERSWHMPLCKYFSSDEDKEMRKHFKKHLELVFDLLHVQDFEIRAAAHSMATANYRSYSSFSRTQGMSSAVADVSDYVRKRVYDPKYPAELRPETVECMIQRCAYHVHDLSEQAAIKEAYATIKDSHGNYRYEERAQYRIRRIPEIIQTLEMKAPIVALRDEFLAEGGFMCLNKKVVLEPFLTEKPKGKYYYSKGGFMPTEFDLLKEHGS